MKYACCYSINLFTFASAYLQGRVKIPIGGIVREPEGRSRANGKQTDGLQFGSSSRTRGMSRCDYGTDSDSAGWHRR